jgi:sugar O-acyltransferase (sialic acid O-acetyltransferase NeuD family)
MKNPLVIFGSGDIAELAHYYFSTDSDYEVIGFSVDSDYLKDDSFCGLPVVPFENIELKYNPTEVHFFAALSYSKLNLLRKEKYLIAKMKGYKIANYISSRATILNAGKIGENCFILEDNTIQPFVRIGNNVTLWSGNHIGHHSVIGDHTFIASHVVVSGRVNIGEQCFIGVNATLRDHISIGSKSVIGAGTLILRDCEEESLYIGIATKKAEISSSKLKSI